MSRRTSFEIEKDYKIIRKYIDNNPSISSFQEIANGTDLTLNKVHTSLSKHPRIYEKIKELVSNNHEDSKTQNSNKTTTQDDKKEIASKKQADFVNYVIDASITGIESLYSIFDEIFNTSSKIILTSVTIKELKKMQYYNDIDGNDARQILAMAAETPENFKIVNIDETLNTSSECVVKYCSENKENIVLMTSNKTMALAARAYGIKTRYFRQNKKLNTREVLPKSRISTLYSAKKIDEKLVISKFNSGLKFIQVISDKIEYKEGTYELKIGDDVYVATKKSDYLTFAHYKIISLDAENNCNLIFSRRFYDVHKIKNLPIASYREFMRDFNTKINS